MTQTVHCPADGCEYSGVRSSVLGHYSGTRDDAHAGGYERARTLLDGDSTAADTPQDDSDTEDEGKSEAIDPPSFEDDSDDADDEPTCPECGGNHYFDASEYTDYAYGCAECSHEGEWVVFN